jgi:DNA-binding CsgD family transcriptional regulator
VPDCPKTGHALGSSSVTTAGLGDARSPVTVVVGVDGSGRTYRLEQLAAGTGADVVRIGWTATVGPALRTLLNAGAAGATVLVDDAHRFDPAVLVAVLEAVHAGARVLLSRRPTVTGPAMADLDAEVAARGAVQILGPLSDSELAGLLGSDQVHRVEQVRRGSCGLAAIAACLAEVPAGQRSPALAARVQRRMALLDFPTATVARLLSLGLPLPDDVLATAAGVGAERSASAVRRLREEGLVDPAGEEMIPAVAELVLADLPPAQLRLLHDVVAKALLERGADVLPAAQRLRAARLRTPSAALIYRTAGERLRFADPGQALRWLEEAVDAGLDPRLAAVSRAEAGLMIGTVGEADLTLAGPDEFQRARRVEGAYAAHAGRAGRAADLLLEGGALGRLLAVPSLVAVGRLAEASDCAGTPDLVEAVGPLALRRLAEAALAVPDPDVAVPLLIEAAEALGRGRVGAVLPDTPQALAAPVAVLAGDAASVESMLGDAVAAGVGGPAGVQRHRLLLAWVRLRVGRFDTAVAELAALGRAVGTGRERLLCAALEAGLARRSGDIARLRAAWARAEPVLARRAVDVLQVELLEELLVAAARLRRTQRVQPVLAVLEAQIHGLGSPTAWLVALGWARLQLAIVVDDPDAAAREASHLAGLAPSGGRQRAQVAAAVQWATVLAGSVDANALGAVLEELAAHQLPWEASRLAGQAAIRATDAGAARRLLERARELSSVEAQLDSPRTVAPGSGLSEREIEVAQLVMAGRTHREIGNQLYLSPKTVEHHVARIRTKLGATTRAELLATLRSVLGEGSDG